MDGELVGVELKTRDIYDQDEDIERVSDECPNCEIKMEEVEGELVPAQNVGGYIVDSKWGKWYECPKCGFQSDPI